jgi:hypothetical protein
MLPDVEDEPAPPEPPARTTDPDTQVDGTPAVDSAGNISVDQSTPPEAPGAFDGPDTGGPDSLPATQQAAGDSEVAADTSDAPPAADGGGPDEFDEKNRPFTSYIDSLLGIGAPSAGGDGDSDTGSVSESIRSTRRLSLLDAVYGGRRLEIVRSS